MKVLFTTTAVLVVLLGLAWLIATEAMLRSWDVEADAVTVYMARRYGGLLLGYALLLWVARVSPPSAARDAIVITGLAVTLVMGALSLYGILAGTVGPAAWSAFVIEAGLAAWFGRAWVASRRGAP